jgi:hypothetical protein
MIPMKRRKPIFREDMIGKIPRPEKKSCLWKYNIKTEPLDYIPQEKEVDENVTNK